MQSLHDNPGEALIAVVPCPQRGAYKRSLANLTNRRVTHEMVEADFLSLSLYVRLHITAWLERSLMVRWVVGSILHGVDPLSYMSSQPVLHDWCNKGRGMYYPVSGMVHIKEPLLLIGKSSPCSGSGFLLSLSEWSFTIYLTPYNRKYNVLSAS